MGVNSRGVSRRLTERGGERSQVFNRPTRWLSGLGTLYCHPGVPNRLADVYRLFQTREPGVPSERAAVCNSDLRLFCAPMATAAELPTGAIVRQSVFASDAWLFGKHSIS